MTLQLNMPTLPERRQGATSLPHDEMTLHGSGTAQPSDAPLRVLILTDHVGGGTGRHILSLVGAFDPARAQVVVMSEGSVHSESPEALRVRRMPRLSHLHRFPFAQAHSLRLLMAELRRSPVDVLHTYGLWPILYGRLLKKLGRVQHLVENRECDGPTWGMHCDPVLRASGSAADRVICVSRSVAEDVAAREGLGDRAIEVIENGATKTEARYSREEARRLLGLPPEAFVIGCVASHIDRPVKGITHLAGAAPEILRRVPDAWFVIVGGRSPGSPVEGEMQRRQIMHRVVLPGYRDDVADLYPAMDVLAMPSLSEGLSIALLEAMRHSVPIVATRVGGNPEVLVEGETGFLVNVGDAVALADRIIALAEAPALREAMGRAGSDRFERVFNINQTARRYEQLYGTVCREHVVSG